MKVILLDIDSVLNSPMTANPRKSPYIVEKRLLTRLQASGNLGETRGLSVMRRSSAGEEARHEQR
jgi:hypothetical protein